MCQEPRALILGALSLGSHGSLARRDALRWGVAVRERLDRVEGVSPDDLFLWSEAELLRDYGPR